MLISISAVILTVPLLTGVSPGATVVVVVVVSSTSLFGWSSCFCEVFTQFFYYSRVAFYFFVVIIIYLSGGTSSGRVVLLTVSLLDSFVPGLLCTVSDLYTGSRTASIIVRLGNVYNLKHLFNLVIILWIGYHIIESTIHSLIWLYLV